MRGCFESASRVSRRNRCAAIAVLAVACSLAAQVSTAQSWTGGASLGVQVRGTKGGPVAGATVEIRHRRPGGNVGPDARLTDTRGQANFVGLTAGRWSLEVRHPDFLSFVASVEIAGGEKPRVISQFLEASGAGRGTLKVKLLRSDKTFGQVVPGTGAEAPSPEPGPRIAQAPPVPQRQPTEAPAKQRAEPGRPAKSPAPAGRDGETQPQPSETKGGVEGRAVPSQVVELPPTPPKAEPNATDADIRPAEVPRPLETLPTPKPAPAAEAPASTEPPSMPAPAAVEPSAELAAEAPQPTQPTQPTQPPEAPADTQRVPPTPVPEAPPEPTPKPPQPSTMPQAGAEPPKPEAPADPMRAAPAQPDPEPAPAMEPPTVEVPPLDAAPQPAVEPIEEPPAAPEVMAPVALPAPESLEASLRAYRDRTCSDCKPGEWAVTVALSAPGGEACRPTAENAIRRAMRDVAAAASDRLGGYSGPLPLDPTAIPLALSTEAARNTLAPYLQPSSPCRLLAAVIPQGARFTGFRFEASDSSGQGECAGSGECEIGQARFAFSPGIARGLGASIVYTLFENTGGSVRTARMSGFFIPASDWRP